MTTVDARGKIEPYTWKAIANVAAFSLAAIATELQGIRKVMEREFSPASTGGRPEQPPPDRLGGQPPDPSEP